VIVVLGGAESERALSAARLVATKFAARIVVAHVVALVSSAHAGRRPLHADEYAHETHPRELVAQLRADGFEADLDTYTTSLCDPATTL
jgi:nucleotide-binding universal stress UspA family protein